MIVRMWKSARVVLSPDSSVRPADVAALVILQDDREMLNQFLGREKNAKLLEEMDGVRGLL